MTAQKMFANRFFAHLSAQDQNKVIQAIEAQLKPALFKDDGWIAKMTAGRRLS